MAFSLKPNEELTVSAMAATIVYGIFTLDAPNLADVKASPSANSNVHGSVKTAAWTSAIAVSGIALLAKSPTVFVVGGLMTIAESWKFYHANATSHITGKLDPAAVSKSY